MGEAGGLAAVSYFSEKSQTRLNCKLSARADSTDALLHLNCLQMAVTDQALLIHTSGLVFLAISHLTLLGSQELYALLEVSHKASPTAVGEVVMWVRSWEQGPLLRTILSHPVLSCWPMEPWSGCI